MAGLVACALVAAGWLLLVDHSEQDRSPSGAPSAQALADREHRLATLLDALEDSLGRGAETDLAAPGGVATLAAIDANVNRIGFRTLELRYVAPAPSIGPQIGEPGTWTADVQVTWRFRRYDAANAVLEVPMIVVDDGDVARFGGIARPAQLREHGRVPLWMAEPLAVRKAERILVLAADPRGLRNLARIAARAVASVDEVLPAWKESLVLAAPSTGAMLDLVLGTDPSTTTQLAGVTTTADGSASRGAVSQVLLNPTVFDRLGPVAAQIVVSHETAHVATDGASSTAPAWLVEGFADYVALRDVGIPTPASAAQALREVRRHGPPPELPGAADFSGENAQLGATYEEAWLACRLIAQQYGEPSLVAFYRQADQDGGAARAFRRVLGTTEEEFTRMWRDHLTALANMPLQGAASRSNNRFLPGG